MDRIPIKSNPTLFDAEVAKMQVVLGDRLPWLDHVFGLCEVLTEVKERTRFTSANLYVGNGEYERIMPCEELGNFAFFYLRDPQEFVTRNKNLIRSPYSLVLWYNMGKVSLPTDERNREALKGQILDAIKSAHNPHFEVSRIYENPRNVFNEFSYDHTDNQFLMSPYSGLRIDGTITIAVPCE